MKCAFCDNEAAEGKTYCSRACANKHRRIKEREARTTYRVWSCGGGVQSVAIGLLMCDGKIPKPDYAVMVDTGYEKTATLNYVRNTLMPILYEHGIELSIINTNDYTDNAYLVDDYCLIPGFRFASDGNVDKFKTNCNQKWKVNVIRKWLLENGVEQYVSYIGISTDESHRQRKAHQAYYSNQYPLIELNMNRQDCIEYIKSYGLPVPPRSSCVMCAQQAEYEWYEMAYKNHDDLLRAIDIEKKIRKKVPNFYLHRSRVTLEDLFQDIEG